MKPSNPGWRKESFARVLLLGGLLSCTWLAAAAPDLFTAAREGLSLAARLREQRPLPEASGSLTTRRADGSLVVHDVRLKVVEHGSNRWSTVYETNPRGTAGQGTSERLEVIRESGQAIRYRLAAAPGGEGKPGPVAEVSGAQAAVAFARTDFWLSDLGLEFLAWPEQRVLRSEMRKSRSCKVLESLNPGRQGEDYARVISWVDIETGNLLRAEAYDAAGKRRKEFSVSKVGKAQGRWQVREIRIYDHRADSTTTLEFELDVPEP